MDSPGETPVEQIDLMQGLLTYEQAGELLGVVKSTIQAWVRSGEIANTIIAGKRRIHRDEIAKLIEAQRAAGIQRQRKNRKAHNSKGSDESLRRVG